LKTLHIVRRCLICTACQMLLGYEIMKSRVDGARDTGTWMGACRVFVRKPEGNRPLGRRRRKWEDSIEIVGQEIGWMRWNGLIWVRRGTGGMLL